MINPAEQIPISILEHILEYADAPAVAVASQVCTAWHCEIQHASPNLWKHLLEQRSWPLPPVMNALQLQDNDRHLQSRIPGGSSTSGSCSTTLTGAAAGKYFQSSSSLDSTASNGTSTTTTASENSNNNVSTTSSNSNTATNLNGLQDTDISHDVANLLRKEFIQHYSVRREMLAIQRALTGLLPRRGGGGSSSKLSTLPSARCEHRDTAVHSFSTRRGAPQPPSHCVSVEIWSPNCVLAAYSHDCTLRLFQAVSKGGGGGGRDHNTNSLTEEKSCREVFCQRIDPYKHTRKKTCIIETMGLDETVVGCLCRITDETTLGDTNRIRQRYNLVVIHRDDLLVFDSKCADSGISEPEEGALTVIDVEVAVINYVLSLDHADHRLLRLHDFLTMGAGDVEDVELLVSPTMATCGAGRFMVEVAISIPVFLDDEDDEQALHSESGMTMELIDRKMFLFSSTECAIVWMGESHSPSEALQPRLEDISLVSLPTSTGATTTASATDTIPSPGNR